MIIIFYSIGAIPFASPFSYLAKNINFPFSLLCHLTLSVCSHGKNLFMDRIHLIVLCVSIFWGRTTRLYLTWLNLLAYMFSTFGKGTRDYAHRRLNHSGIYGQEPIVTYIYDASTVAEKQKGNNTSKWNIDMPSCHCQG